MVGSGTYHSRRSLVWRRWLFRHGGVFILCVNLCRYFHLMGSSIFTLWGHGQSKSLFLRPRHSQVMRKPTSPLPPGCGGKSMQNYRKLRYASCVMGTDDLRGLVRLSVQFGIVYDLACSRQLT